MKRRSARTLQPQHARFVVSVHYRASLAPQTGRAGAGERERCGISFRCHSPHTSIPHVMFQTRRITVCMHNELAAYNERLAGKAWERG